MNPEQQQVAIAVAAQTEFKRIHDQFVAKVASTANKVANGGSFTTDGEDFSASALGVNFRVVRRPISIQGQFLASEYAFITEYEGKDLCLWCFYMDEGGVLYTDSALSKRLCDFDNTYLPSRVVEGLANSLLASTVFAPRA